MISTFTRTLCDCGFTSLDPQGLDRKFDACPHCGAQVKYKHDIHLLNCKCGGCGVMFQINADHDAEQPTVCPVPTCQSTNVKLMGKEHQIDFSKVTKEEYLKAQEETRKVTPL